MQEGGVLRRRWTFAGSVAVVACVALAIAVHLTVPPRANPWLWGAVLLVPLAVLLWFAWRCERRTEQELRGLRRQAQALQSELVRLSKVATLGERASQIVHDLNNPLAIINEEAGWMLDLLAGEGAESHSTRAELANSAEQVQVQVGRTREIVRRTLEWTRGLEETGQDVDINAVLTQTLRLLEEDLSTSGIRVERSFSPNVPPVKGSASELRQAFLNLVKNALDAMSAGGGVLTLDTRPSGGGAEIVVADTGCGIPPDRITRIFDPFFTTKTEGHGSGLGLSICDWIVRAHGGSVRVESWTGKGSAFTIRLPAARGPHPGQNPH